MTSAVQAIFAAAIIGTCALLGFAPHLYGYELIGLIIAAILLRAWAEIIDLREDLRTIGSIARALAKHVALVDQRRGKA